MTKAYKYFILETLRCGTKGLEYALYWRLLKIDKLNTPDWTSMCYKLKYQIAKTLDSHLF